MRLGEHSLILVVAAFLTWLLVMGLAPRDPMLAGAARELSTYSKHQGHLRADVLAARTGALRSYDPLVAYLDAMRGNVARLRRVGSGQIDGALLASLDRSLAEQEALVEQFKTRNALLQNSLTHVSLFSATSAAAPEDGRLRMAAGAAWGALMRLTLDTSPPAVADARRRLARLERLCAQRGCAARTADLLAHGTLLSRQLPMVDRLVERTAGPAHRAVIARLAERLAERQRLIDRRTLHFRFLLYLASLLLLCLVGRWGMRLRAQSAALRRQAAVEHAVASLSAGLIGANAGTMAQAVSDGLTAIGKALGAAAAGYHSARMGDFWSTGAPGPPLHRLARDLRARSLSTDGAAAVATSVQLAGRDVPESLRLAFEEPSLTCFCLFVPDARRCDFLLVATREQDAPVHPDLVPVLQTAYDAITLAIEQAYVDRERAALERQVRHARRMQTIGTFTSGIAHNFNNLLGAIIGNAEIAQARLQRIGAPTENTDEILLTAERGRALVESLLDYGRRPDRQRRWVPLDQLVAETVRMASAAMPGRRLVIEPGLRGALSLIDPVQTQQVFLNLCHNAGQATAQGAVIRIRTDAVALARELRHAHGAIAPGRYLRVCVRDAGAGMSPSVLLHAFEPFYSTRPSGTGLGLATAREIVREAGGEIAIESREGFGTEAQVWLPAAPQARRPRPTPSSTAGLRGTGETILYLAASERSRLAGEELLAALGYEPVGFTLPADAFRACREQPGRFDALLAEHLGSGAEPLVGDEDWSCLPGVRLVAARHIGDVDSATQLLREVSAVIRLPLDAVELTRELHRHLAAGRGRAPLEPQAGRSGDPFRYPRSQSAPGQAG